MENTTQRDYVDKAWEPPIQESYKPGHVFSVAKLVLGGFNLVFGFIVLGMGIDFIVNSRYGYTAWFSIFIVTIAAGISIVWQSAEFLIRLLRRHTHRPIHPGAHLAVHLILSVFFALCSASLAFALQWSISEYTVGLQDDCGYEPEYEYLCDDYDHFDTYANAAIYFTKLEALLAFTILMTLVHITLFVMACAETHHRRLHGKRTKVVYLVAAPGMEPGTTYYTQVPAPEAAQLSKRQPIE